MFWSFQGSILFVFACVLQPVLGDVLCTNKGGTCQSNTITCINGEYERGLCSGAASRQCCVPSPADLPCANKRGVCQENRNACNGEYQRGLCGGGVTRQCCVPTSGGSSTGCSKVRIISRNEWQAANPTSTSALSYPVNRFFIHHTATPSCNSISTCSERVRSIQHHHMNTNKWSDIGYSFLVGNDGNVYEGRGWSRVGAHTSGYNNDFAASFIGTFTDQLPISAALNAAKNLIQCGVDKGYIKSSYTLHGHRDVSSTTCPGNMLYAEIRKWPHYQSNP